MEPTENVEKLPKNSTARINGIKEEHECEEPKIQLIDGIPMVKKKQKKRMTEEKLKLLETEKVHKLLDYFISHLCRLWLIKMFMLR